MPPNTDRANQAVYVWSRIDPRQNRLIRDKFMLVTQEARQDIEKESNRILLANRANVNRTGVELEILRMWAQKINSVAEKHYEILFHHWKLLGERKTGAFVRACSAILERKIERLGGSQAHKARMVHRRRGGIGQSLEKSYEKSAGGIANQWRNRLDIEARELDLAESVAHAKKNHAAAPIPKRGQNLPLDAPMADPFALVQQGQIVIEGGPLSTDRDTSAASIALLQKLGFGNEQHEWPSSFFGPVLPEVLKQLKRAHKILTAKGFLFVGDPLNPAGDGRSWVLKLEPTDKLSTRTDLAEFTEGCLQSEGIKVAAKPVQDGRTLLVALWDSDRGPNPRQHTPFAKSGRTATGSKKPSFYPKTKSYQTLVFRGREYTLTPQAGAIVKVLHATGGKPVSKADIQDQTNCGKVSDSFRCLDGPQVWKKLIEVTKGRKGFYCLRPQAFSQSR